LVLPNDGRTSDESIADSCPTVATLRAVAKTMPRPGSNAPPLLLPPPVEPGNEMLGTMPYGV
jgi:hypothetical protein